MSRQIIRLVATCKTMEVARIGPAAILMRRAGIPMPYAFATDDMMLDSATSDAIIADATIETGGYLAHSPDGRRIPTMSAILDAEKLDLDASKASILMAIIDSPLRTARLAGKMALVEMTETESAPSGFLEEDEDGAYDQKTRLAAQALLRIADSRGGIGPGAQVVLMGRGQRPRQTP